MSKTHHYTAKITWTGNLGKGTENYKAYNRNHDISVQGKKHTIMGSSDPAFLGDKERYNPEEMLLASLSSCHMLWYLHLCATNGIILVDYVDEPTGTMTETSDGGGHFTEVTLRPKIKITNGDKKELAMALHEQANKLCFIANSCNFPVHHAAEVEIVAG